MNLQNSGMSFPKGLSYAFTRFSNGFSRQIDRIEPDRKTDVRDGSTIRFKINPNTKFGLRSLSMYYKFTVTPHGQVAAGQANPDFYISRFHPRYSSSIIKNITIKMNQYSVDNVEEYGLLYNTLVDMNMSTDQISKRFLENIDPSIKYTSQYAGDEFIINAPYGTNVYNAADRSDNDRRFVINNFLNLLGSSSVEYLDTNDIGTFEIELTLNPANICFRNAIPGGINIDRLQALQYTLNDIYMTYERINFEDPLYDQIKQAKIMSEEGLEFAWTSYSTKVGPIQDRSINFSFTENASSLDSIICTTRREDYSTVSTLLQQDYSAAAATASHQLQVATTGVNCFNQSRYFQRDLATLTNSQIYVNGTAMYKQPQTPEEIFNENMIVLNGNTDTTHNIHGGCNSIPAFLKYYFTKILSLHYNKEYQNYLISGLNGGGSSFNITWITNADQNANTIAAGVNRVQPIVFCQKSQVLKILPGKQIAILP